MTVSLVALQPALVVTMMIIVGTEITRRQLTAAVRMPGVLGGATLAQLLLLPLLAVLLVWLLRPSPAVAGGLVLLAISPGGGMSNYYCALARLNVSLSVTLTFVSGLIALAAMPLLFAIVVPAALGIEAFSVPITEMVVRLVLFLLLPIGVGIFLRHRFAAFIERFGGQIRGFGLGLLATFLTLIFIDERNAVATMFAEASAVIIAFSLLAALAGWLVGCVLTLHQNDRAVVAIEFATRNVAIAALLALTVFQQPEFAAFGALFLLLQAPILLLAMLFNPKRRLHIAAPSGAD